jgi:two-component system sensor histidine kinase/response regulator
MPAEIKILIVEDEALTRLRLRSLLGKLGYDAVTEAVDGSEALRVCAQEPPNLVLTDLRMPEMDGFRLLDWMSTRFPEIPIIVISGVDSQQEAIEAFRHGAWDYFAKPIADTGTFEMVLRRALGHAELLRTNRQYQAHLEALVTDRTHALKELNEDLEHRVEARTAELEAVNRELDAFTYSVSHDLKAPLRSITGFSRTLAEEHSGTLHPEGRHALARIQANALRMGQLIEDLLDLSKVTRTPIQRRNVDLSDLAAKVLEALQLAESGRRVDSHVQQGLETWADPGLLRIVLENLLGNAWKYTSKAANPLVEFAQQGQQEGFVTFRVSDNGAGFDMAHKEKLFVAFQRLHTRQDFEGTGIGLAIVQRIVHRHGGRVWAESEPGKGATFFFTLPDRGDS